MGKIATFGEKARKIVSGLKFNYLKEDDSALGKVDFGVLTVAMMVAALDGTILPDELKAFNRLARQCRVGEGEQAVRYEATLHSAGYVLLMSRSGISEKALTQVFLREAEKVLPKGFVGGKAEDIRRALVLWITMGLSDGDFCGIERMCVTAFCAKVSEVMQRCRDCRKECLWIGLRPGGPVTAPCRTHAAAQSSKRPEAGWMAEAERLVKVGDTAAIRAFIRNG